MWIRFKLVFSGCCGIFLKSCLLLEIKRGKDRMWFSLIHLNLLVRMLKCDILIMFRSAIRLLNEIYVWRGLTGPILQSTFWKGAGKYFVLNRLMPLFWWFVNSTLMCQSTIFAWCLLKVSRFLSVGMQSIPFWNCLILRMMSILRI